MQNERPIARPYTGPVRAVVFDWAGTLVDHGSRAPAAVFQGVFAAQGIEITVAEARAPMGLAKREHIQTICRMPQVAERWQAKYGRGPTEADVDAMYTSFLPAQMKALPGHADVIPGVPETLAALRARGIRVGSSTGYTRELMDILAPLAAAQGVAPEAILTTTEVPGGRPRPWMLFENAKLLDVYPMAAVVKVDDTVSGIEAARNAGCWAVGVVETGNMLGLSEAELTALDPAEREARAAAARAKFFEHGAHYVMDGVPDLPGVLEDIEAHLKRGHRP